MMLEGQNLIRTTHYEVLSVQEDASYEEIRSSYRTAILKSHPDKIHSINGATKSDSKSEDTFHRIQRAWEILSCSASRALYDSELKAARRDLVMADDVQFENMVAADDGEALVFHYQCRCGDYFSTDSFELEAAGYNVVREDREVSLQTSDGMRTAFILPCPSCSLKI
uniref:DPH4 homolog n=1 Tax=Kalanchoe fedtschenkoi TaxID=63787 RepID=A0A7N0SXN8_KALFE